MEKFVQGDPEEDFFDQNPELKQIPYFKKLIEIEGRERASRLLWLAYLIEDTRSIFFRYKREERKELVEQEDGFWGEPFPWEDYEELFEKYSYYAMPRNERQYKKAEQVFQDELDRRLDPGDVDINFYKAIPKYKKTLNDWREEIKQDRKKRKDMIGGQEAGAMYDQ